jgi:hypothetical protein
MAPGLDLELTPLGASREAEPRTRFYGTGLSFRPCRPHHEPPGVHHEGVHGANHEPRELVFRRERSR